MPFIERQLEVLERLTIPWRWVVAEGAAMNTKCTSWCKPQKPRLSKDGTSEFLLSIINHPNVIVLRSPRWEGKVEMFRSMTAMIEQPCALAQIDADEFYTPHQLETVVRLFERDAQLNMIRERHHYRFGHHLAATAKDGTQFTGDWMRFWRFYPGMDWQSHEPPVLGGNRGKVMLPDESLKLGIYADHYAYVMESQVAYKESYYGYRNAVKLWMALQSMRRFPVPTRQFIPWGSAREDITRSTIPSIFDNATQAAPVPAILGG